MTRVVIGGVAARRRIVAVHDLGPDRRCEIPYDALVIATGARAAGPALSGVCPCS